MINNKSMSPIFEWRKSSMSPRYKCKPKGEFVATFRSVFLNILIRVHTFVEYLPSMDHFIKYPSAWTTTWLTTWYFYTKWVDDCPINITVSLNYHRYFKDLPVVCGLPVQNPRVILNRLLYNMLPYVQQFKESVYNN